MTKHGFSEAFKPNGVPNKKIYSILLVGWITFGVLSWVFGPDSIPKPGEVFERMVFLYRERNLLGELFTSYWTLGKSMLFTVVISLIATYLTVIPAWRVPATFITVLRFLGMAGLTYPIFRIWGVTEDAKIAILTFGMTTWFVTSMSKIVADIPEVKYDHARSLGWSEWRVSFEVVVLGTAHLAFDTMRQIFAMAFMMITLVEGLVRSLGGIGVMLLNNEKHFVLADIIAILSVLLTVALIQDLVFGWLGRQLFPYATAATERK